MDYRTPQPYIYGDKGVGKSHIMGGKRAKDSSTIGMRQANPKVKPYIMQKNGNFANYDDDLYHILYMDEFKMANAKEHMDLQIWNTILSGERTIIWKMHGEVVKDKWLPVLTTSNFHPKKSIGYDVEPKEMDTFLSRLDVYQQFHHATVQWIPELPISSSKTKERETMVIPHDSDSLADSHQQSQSEDQREESLPTKIKSKKKYPSRRYRRIREEFDQVMDEIISEESSRQDHGEEDRSE